MLDRGGLTGPAGRRDTWEDWGSVSKTLHWLVAAMVASLFATGCVLSRLPDGDPHAGLWLAAHATAGALALILTLGRLAWRRRNRTPVLPDTLSATLRRIARMNHRAFSSLLIVLPIVGWLAADFGGAPGLVGDEALAARVLLLVHVVGSWAMAALIWLHVVAALHHETVLKDRVLRRMLPLPARLQRWPVPVRSEQTSTPSAAEAPATTPPPLRSPHRP